MIIPALNLHALLTLLALCRFRLVIPPIMVELSLCAVKIIPRCCENYPLVL